jgi:hypothetical protein
MADGSGSEQGKWKGTEVIAMFVLSAFLPSMAVKSFMMKETSRSDSDYNVKGFSH